MILFQVREKAENFVVTGSQGSLDSEIITFRAELFDSNKQKCRNYEVELKFK